VKDVMVVRLPFPSFPPCFSEKTHFFFLSSFIGIEGIVFFPYKLWRIFLSLDPELEKCCLFLLFPFFLPLLSSRPKERREETSLFSFPSPGGVSPSLSLLGV